MLPPFLWLCLASLQNTFIKDIILDTSSHVAAFFFSVTAAGFWGKVHLKKKKRRRTKARPTGDPTSPLSLPGLPNLDHFSPEVDPGRQAPVASGALHRRVGGQRGTPRPRVFSADHRCFRIQKRVGTLVLTSQIWRT